MSIIESWPKDNLLDDMADEYAAALEPIIDFARYGVRNPWAFRLAVKDALIVTDGGDVLLDPAILPDALDFYMRPEERMKAGCIGLDEPIAG